MATAPNFNTAFKSILNDRKDMTASVQKKVCPEHSSSALPSLTLQNYGCSSCAALNSSEKKNSGLNFDTPCLKQEKNKFLESHRERNDNSQKPARIRLNQPHFCKSETKVVDPWKEKKEKQHVQSYRSNDNQEEARKINELFKLSRTFYRQTDHGSDSKTFDGTGINPHPDKRNAFSRNNNGDSAVCSQRSLNNSHLSDAQTDKLKPTESSSLAMNYNTTRSSKSLYWTPRTSN